MKKRPVFKFQPFSRKQRMVLNWWTDKSPVKDYDGIIADGAIRSRKNGIHVPVVCDVGND